MDIEYYIKGAFASTYGFDNPPRPANPDYKVKRNEQFEYFMEVPIPEHGLVDIPLFVLPYFELYRRDLMRSSTEKVDKFIIPMYYGNEIRDYKTVPSAYASCANESFNRYRFYRIAIAEKSVVNYVSQGIILDRSFSPLYVCSVLFDIGEDNSISLKDYIVRLKPSVFLTKTDLMEKFLANKVFKAFLYNDVVSSPIVRSMNVTGGASNSYKAPRLIIEPFPWKVKKVDSPSIETTDQQLTQLVLDNIDETLDLSSLND